MGIYKDMTQNIRSSAPPCSKLGNTLEDCSLVALSKILKFCHVCVFVCAEGRGKTEGAEKATGAHQGGPSTLRQNFAATARPGAMEAPHSAEAGQHKGKSSDVCFQQEAGNCTAL